MSARTPRDSKPLEEKQDWLATVDALWLGLGGSVLGEETDSRSVCVKDCQLSLSVDEARNEETPTPLRVDWAPAPRWFNPSLTTSPPNDIGYGRRPIDCRPYPVVRFG